MGAARGVGHVDMGDRAGAARPPACGGHLGRAVHPVSARRRRRRLCLRRRRCPLPPHTMHSHTPPPPSAPPPTPAPRRYPITPEDPPPETIYEEIPPAWALIAFQVRTRISRGDVFG